MNDRIVKTLEKAGIKEPPLGSLDHEQQFFALTSEKLMYQASEQKELNQVTLREISRIHSDHEGTLRVEAGGRTAVTASLLGFDPGRVQRFFQMVRDTTARAKQQPSSPLPGGSSQDSAAKTFAPSTTPSTTVITTAPVSSVAASPPVESRPGASGPNTGLGKPVSSANTNAHSDGATPASTAPRPVPDPALSEAPEKANKPPETTAQPAAGQSSAPSSAAPPPAPAMPTAPAAPATPPSSEATLGSGPRVVKIGGTSPSAPLDMTASSSGANLGSGRANKPAATQTAAPTSASGPGTSTTPARPLTPGNAASTAVSNVAVSQPQAASGESGTLGQAASSLGGLATTVRVLAVVLVLGALGMGYFLWQQGGNQIPALWTVTIGLVTAVALSVLAELLKFLATLGRAVANLPGQPN